MDWADKQIGENVNWQYTAVNIKQALIFEIQQSGESGPDNECGKTYRLNLENGAQWENIEDMIEPVRSATAVANEKHKKIFVIGGYQKKKYMKTIQYFDVQNEK